MNSTMRRVTLCVVLVFLGLVLWKMISSGSKVQEISYPEFLSQVNQGKVSEVTIAGNEARGEYKNDKDHQFRLVVPSNSPEMLKALQQNGVSVVFKDSQSGNWSLWLAQLSPVIVLVVLFVFGCVALLAQLKLFSIDKTLKEILQEMKQRDIRK